MGNRQLIPVYAVIGDGPTESAYFKSIKSAFKEELSHCYLKPDIQCRHATVAELKRLINMCLNKGYKKVLCVVDMDTKLRNNQEMQQYTTLKGRFQSNHKVQFFETLPCTELWFYYYFAYASGTHLECYEPHVKNLIKKKIPNYEKETPFCTHSYILKQGGDWELAIANSRKSMKRRVENGAYSDMARFFEEIGLIIV